MSYTEQIKNAYLFKKGLKQSLTESETNLSLLYSEEELKNIFYEKTENVKPEVVNKMIFLAKEALDKLKGEEYEKLNTSFNNILNGWELGHGEKIKISKLNQEEIRILYKDLLELFNKNKIKLSLEEINLNLIDTLNK